MPAGVSRIKRESGGIGGRGLRIASRLEQKKAKICVSLGIRRIGADGLLEKLLRALLLPEMHRSDAAQMQNHRFDRRLGGDGSEQDLGAIEPSLLEQGQRPVDDRPDDLRRAPPVCLRQSKGLQVG